jgi:hypothetical protein
MLVFHRHRRDLAALRRQYWSWGEGLMAFVTKTYRADPEQRPKLRGLVGWWLNRAVRAPVSSARGGTPGSPDLPLAELAGGVVGLCGSYARSRRRSAAIEREHA